MTRYNFFFISLYCRRDFFIAFTQQNIKIICYYTVTIIMRQDWWYTGFFFFVSRFVSSEKMSKQQLLMLLCLLWDFGCSLAALVTVNKRFCMQMIKTNSFQSHQRPSKLRWIQSHAAASIKCLAKKNTVFFLHINGHSVVRYREHVKTWLIFKCASLNISYGC